MNTYCVKNIFERIKSCKGKLQEVGQNPMLSWPKEIELCIIELCQLANRTLYNRTLPISISNKLSNKRACESIQFQLLQHTLFRNRLCTFHYCDHRYFYLKQFNKLSWFMSLPYIVTENTEQSLAKPQLIYNRLILYTGNQNKYLQTIAQLKPWFYIPEMWRKKTSHYLFIKFINPCIYGE